ncbi:MAG: hypothetical protein ABI700_14820 [Chloroflexota bacterium]
MARKAQKRCNGSGESLTVFFDKSDPQQQAALSMSQMLGSKHGLRKEVIVALLAALYERYESTGDVLTPIAVTNAIMDGFAISTPAKMFTTMQPASLPTTAERKSDEQPKPKLTGGVVVVKENRGEIVSPNVSLNFMNSMKSLASGFFD